MQSTIVEDATRNVRIEVLVAGVGPDVVLVPSAARGAADFGNLQDALTAAGYRSIAINPRGAGMSTVAPGSYTLRDGADDIATVITALCDGPAHLIGHALGNIFVRATATYRPEVVKTVTVMPCGGHDLATRAPAAHVVQNVGRCHDMTLTDDERLQSLRVAFFAPGNDPSSWLDGWWPGSSGLARAIRTADPEEWAEAGGTDMLIVQPLDDVMASAETGRAFAARLGARATYVEVARCGHAILPEQPELVANAVIDFLRAHSETAARSDEETEQRWMTSKRSSS